MADTLLVVNAGSSSIKFQLFEVAEDDRLELEFRGQMEGIGTRPHLIAKDAAGTELVDDSLRAGRGRRRGGGARTSSTTG